MIKTIASIHQQVDSWRALPEAQWRVTPEDSLAAQALGHHRFKGICPFFCQVEAVETAIWLTEVAQS